MMDELGVATRETHMGFSVTGQDEDFEYAGTPKGLFCQPRNAVRPAFLRMIRELLRFNKELSAVVADPTDARGDLSLLQYLAAGGLLRLLPGPAHRPSGQRRLVSRARSARRLPRSLHGAVLRQPRDAQLQEPPDRG